MNYRHIYHAGNACDVVKHATLALLIERLKTKDKGFAVLDTHAGSGVYNLGDPRALQTNEFQKGASLVWAEQSQVGPEISPYLNALRAFNAGEKLIVYPGSPSIVQHFLRPQDRLIACEKHPEESENLRHTFQDDPRVHVHARDGYEAMRGLLPFSERRGLVLIDPSFEEPGEFDRLYEAISLLHARMPGAIGAMWYPIKDRPAIWRFHESLIAADLPELLVAEFMFRSEERADKLNGSGFVFLHAPWKWEETLSSLFTQLHALLGSEDIKSTIKFLSTA